MAESEVQPIGCTTGSKYSKAFLKPSDPGDQSVSATKGCPQRILGDAVLLTLIWKPADRLRRRP